MYFGHAPGSFNRVWMSVIWDGVSAGGDDHLRSLLQITSEGWEGTQGTRRHKYKSKVTHSHSEWDEGTEGSLTQSAVWRPLNTRTQTLEAVTEIWSDIVFCDAVRALRNTSLTSMALAGDSPHASDAIKSLFRHLSPVSRPHTFSILNTSISLSRPSPRLKSLVQTRPSRKFPKVKAKSPGI